MFRILFRVAIISTVFVSIDAMNHLAPRSRAAAPMPAPQHGLTGSYYLGARGWQTDAPPPAGAFYQVWSDQNDFMLPRIITSPAATRVDAQVAFGQGKGFHVGPNGPGLVWWPTGYAIPQGWAYKEKPWEANHFVAAIWKGYIHLPKAGTYYFGTVSNGASAVYLNQARVALNGWAGGVLVSDAFSYDSNQVHDFVTQNSAVKESYLADPRFQYAVPVPADGPRDLPIEIDYDLAKSPSNWGSLALGIDLFWITPDSPRDGYGKALASIVPSEALFTEAPGPIDNTVVRSANSTLTADFLDFYFPSEKSVTLTVRLADKAGNPVAGKQVSLSTVGAVGKGYPDQIVQPEKPTDEHGETSGKIRVNQTYPVPHDTAIFATDVTDLVDVGQVGHVAFRKIEAGSFFPDTFSPYYDPHAPEITPMPLQVGRQLTVNMPLVNRNKYEADLDVIFEIHGWNIGAGDWQEIGRVKNVRLRPGEHKDVSIHWTPDQATGHICFRVGVNATKIVNGFPSGHVLSATMMPILFPQAGNGQQKKIPPFPGPLRPGGAYNPIEHAPNGGYQQDNKGPVSPRDVGDSPWGFDKSYWKGVYDGSQGVNSWCEAVPQAIEKIGKELEPVIKGAPYVLPIVVAKIGKWTGKNVTKKGAFAVTVGLKGICAWNTVAGGIAETIWLDPPDQNFPEVYVPYNYQLPPPMASAGIPEVYVSAFNEALRNELEIVSLSTAALVSIERFQGAKAAANQSAANRQLLAYMNYTSQTAQAYAREGQLVQNLVMAGRASGVPDILLTADEARETQQLQAKDGFTDDILAALGFLGVDEDFVERKIMPAVTSADPEKAAGSLYDKLLEMAKIYRSDGNALTDQWTLNYSVGNPHEKTENVDLFVRPISIPPDWKLSIVNAEQAPGKQLPPGDPPAMPVHEIEAGKHYAVTLPPKAQVNVTSVVVPVGEVGARTTVRWAVEGKIGDELIGGIVHEMNVPYNIADLQLPPVGPKGVEEELPGAPSGGWARIVAEIAAAIIVIGLLMFFFIFWRKRRGTETPHTP